MKTERQVRKRLKTVEKNMVEQVKQGMKTGWPVLFWDANCVERRVLRDILGEKLEPFCAADTMAGW